MKKHFLRVWEIIVPLSCKNQRPLCKCFDYYFLNNKSICNMRFFIIEHNYPIPTP